MKSVVKYFFIFLGLIFLAYLMISSPDYPVELSDAIRSGEPADLETSLRREYYTNSFRAEVMEHYLTEFKTNKYLSILSYRLNYPPEEAQVKIRDQTRSSYLEEIVHPFRESIFVNGFEPKLDENAIVINGEKWNSKVIVRYYPSNVMSRLAVGLFSIVFAYLVFNQWTIEIASIIGYLRKR
jgi:hypothetical protein